MATKIGNLSKWRKLPVGSVLEFDTHPGATLRIEFNTEVETRIDAIDAKSNVTFVATVKGNEIVEFSVPGRVEIAATSEGEVWYHTGDGKPEVYDLRHLKDFKGIEKRGVRNPELERIMFTMQQNQRRVEATLAETQRLLAERTPTNGQVSAGNTSGTEQQEAKPGEPATAPAAGAGASTAPAGEAKAAGPATK